MDNAKLSPDAGKAGRILAKLWNAVLEDGEPQHDDEIDQLVNSSFVSIRYCLPTQLLGKFTDASLDCLCLQKGAGAEPGAWDPRSFCTKVIVPWVHANQAVLGDSTDPYVGKPLRKPRLEAKPVNVKGASDWDRLYAVLEDVEKKGRQDYTKKRLLQVLASVKARLTRLTFDYPVPGRVSLDQVLRLVTSFLAVGSGGDRGMAVAAALFEVFGDRFKLYERVLRHAVNASDSSTGLVSDIECYGFNGELKLGIEVKERYLTLSDVRSVIGKARKISLKEVLLNTPGSNQGEESEIEALIQKTWASGTNLYRLSIEELMRAGLPLVGEEGRIQFLIGIGNQLDQCNTQPANRMQWKELLDSL